MNAFLKYAIVIIILILIGLIVVKVNRKNFGSEINKLLKCLGGKDNIINAECDMSRFKVILKDMSIIDKEGIQKLGAKGVVEIDNQLKIILDKDAKELKSYIKDIMKK